VNLTSRFKFVLVSALWPAIVLSSQTASLRAYSEPDAAEVYRALIGPQNKRSFLVLSTSRGPNTCSFSEKEIADPEFRQAMHSFRDMKEQKWDLSSVLGDRQTISESELNDTFKPGIMEGWHRFRQKHPDSSGYVALSAVGFNSAHTVAVVYSGGACGPKCGTGGLKYFRRTSKGWQRIRADFPSCDWIS
jgi:hypothetical protein